MNIKNKLSEAKNIAKRKLDDTFQLAEEKEKKLKSFLDNAKELPSDLKLKFTTKIRDKAIDKAKATIAMVGKSPEDFSEEELEIIVKQHEDEIYKTLKDTGLKAALAIFGIQFLADIFSI